MADKTNTRKKTDTPEATPDRVTYAAQTMGNTGSFRGAQGIMPPRPSQGIPKNYPQGSPMYTGSQPLSQGTTPYSAGRAPYGAPTAGHENNLSSTGAYRGFVPQSPPSPPQGPVKGSSKGGNGRKGRGAGAIIAAVLAVVLLGVGGAFAAINYSKTKQVNDKIRPYDDLFVPGVYVDGIHLAGMTPEQAMNSVQSQIRQRNDAWSVLLTWQGTTLARIDAQMLGLSVDVADVLNRAWVQGHTGDAQQRYDDMLRLEQEPYTAYTATPSGDTSVIDGILLQLKQGIETPAQDAQLLSFDPSLDYPFVFQVESRGTSLDIEPVKEQLYRMVSVLESGAVELNPVTVEPSVTRAELMKHYMQRSSVYTPISKSSTEDRNNNIRRAFQSINGYVLDPGKTFSFNSVVGERSTENGFYPAIEYAYREAVMGVGGGVCQASTTLYQAAVCAGLTILKREPHSDEVSYTEYGKDATVFWSGKKKIDLSFKNTTDEPIYIVAAVEQDPSNRKRLIARVTIYGKDMGNVRYEIECQEISTIEPPAPKYIRDTNAEYVTYTDQQKSVSKAKEGHVVKSYRLEYTGSVLTDRKELYTDTYEPQAERIYVGVTPR